MKKKGIYPVLSILVFAAAFILMGFIYSPRMQTVENKSSDCPYIQQKNNSSSECPYMNKQKEAKGECPYDGNKKENKKVRNTVYEIS